MNAMHNRSHLARRVITALVSALVLAPVAALSLWLLMSDAVTAAAVMERGSLLPLFAALANMVGKAIMAALTTL